MSAPEQFTGFMVQSKEKWSDFKKLKFTPKIFEDNDVDIENECCGVSIRSLHNRNPQHLTTLPICPNPFYYITSINCRYF